MSVESPLTIAVLVKYVPDTQFPLHLQSNGALDRSESVLSELDEYPLETALQFIEAHGGFKVGHRLIAITMGPSEAAAAVKKALQIGATEGVHLSDPALAGSDVGATATALAAVVRSLGSVDLILTGMSSTDGETSLLPGQLAARLQLPELSFMSELELLAGQNLAVRGQRDSGEYTEVLESSLPAVVSVTDQINHPRYPNFKSILAARKRPLKTITLADIGIEAAQVGSAGAKTEILSVAARPPRSRGTVITDSGDAGVKLADFLAEQKLI